MFAESPLVEKPTAMSSSPAWAMSWREKTSSKPTSLESAVRTAWSSTSERAGSGLPCGGWRNSSAVPWASVALPPLPKLNSRPPRAKRSAMAAPARSTCSAQRVERGGAQGG